MLTQPCCPRASVLLLVAVLFGIFFITASRLNNTVPVNFSRLAEDWTAALGKGQSHHGQAAQEPLGTGTPGKDGDRFCSQEMELLRRPDLGLTDNIVYTRRCVRPIRGKVDRDEVANITSPLISSTTTLDLKADCSAVEPPPCEPLLLRVPPAYPRRQYPHLLFGVASTYERIKDSLPVFAHWIAGTGAQLVVVISDADIPASNNNNLPDLGALEAEYRAHGIQATLVPPTFKSPIPRKGEDPSSSSSSSSSSSHNPPPGPAPVEQLHFLLIRDMLAHATPQTTWLGVLDDDTFFPSLYPLDQALSRHDHTRPAWLGALADNFVSISMWGYMAFGGAGVFLSVPLARELDPHLESCVRETTVPSGDGMLRDCVYAHTTTKLTLLEGLYQHDIRGDPSGLFESGRHPLLSMHHWKSWYRAPVAAMAGVVRVCGDCFLQRWRFAGDTLLANGYSVTVYRDGLDGVDLGRVEATFRESEEHGGAGGRFGFVYGPFRERLGEKRKKSYRLAAVDGVPGQPGTSGGGTMGAVMGMVGKGDKEGPFRQVYVHRAARGDEEEEKGKAMDEVVELVWEI
ncbi:hypothetical protein VTK26DRAFT_1926 [Humicola hyalothermophila]